ncbi:hypothetical protein [Allomuricauda sp. R78024]|uniref:hypothetical protein n=1 Tax=Allomuricauda sp. R78024 TaxID=3093867 RepID=UPI0037C8B920
MKKAIIMSLKTYKKSYLVAGSLVESVIAITLITICLFIALKLHVTILDKSAFINNSRKLAVLNRLVTNMKMNKNYSNEVFGFETYSIHKTVSTYENDDNLLKVTFVLQESTDTTRYYYLILK